jgi:hypothetical protein
MTAVVSAASCCGSAAATTLRGPSLVADAVLLATRGTLDEPHLVGMDAFALSALVGARGGETVGATRRMRNPKD